MVSVVVIASEAPELVGSTVASALAQSFEAFELIVLDDGVDPATSKLLRACNDPRVRYVVVPTAGVATQRNRAIALARHDMIAFLSPGDRWAPDYLASRVSLLEQHGEAAFAYGWFDAIDAFGRMQREGPREAAPTSLFHRLLLGCLPVTVSNVLVRKSALLEAGGFDPALAQHEDWDMWLRLARTRTAVLDRGVQLWHCARRADLGQSLAAARRVLNKALEGPPPQSHETRSRVFLTLYALHATATLEEPWERGRALSSWRALRRHMLTLGPDTVPLLTPLVQRLVQLRALRECRPTRTAASGARLREVVTLPIGPWRTGGTRVPVDDRVEQAIGMVDAGRSFEAATALKLLFAAHPERAQLPYMLAQMAWEDGREQAARRYAWRAALCERERSEPFALAGHLTHRAGDTVLAVALLKRAVALNPRDDRAWAWLAAAEVARARALKLGMPLVSIIVPVYNGEKTLARTIDSLLVQTLDDFELLIVDDGSTDATASIVRTYTDPRISWLAFPNGGPSLCRNRGAAAAKGRLLAFCDADDLWHPEKLAAQCVALALAPEAEVVYSGVKFIDLADNVTHAAHLPRAEGDMRLALIKGCLPICGSNVMLRREAYMAAGGFDTALPLAEDWDLWLRLSLETRWARVMAHHVFYRLSPTSASTDIVPMERYSRHVLQQAYVRTPDVSEHVRLQAAVNLYGYLANKSLGSAWSASNAVAAWRYLRVAARATREGIDPFRTSEGSWRVGLRRLRGLTATRRLPAGAALHGVRNLSLAVKYARDLGWTVKSLITVALDWQTFERPGIARQFLLKARTLDPTHSQVHFLLADLLIRTGQFEEALAHVIRSLGWNRSHAEPFILAGYLLHLLGDSPLGRAFIARAFALEPDHPRALSCLADLERAPRATTRHPQLEHLTRPATLGVCMIVKNEAKQLRRFLPVLLPHLDELVVLDTGSTDETVAIAMAAGARVARFEWCHDFAAARNTALALGTTDWVLTIDADEELVVPPGDLASLLARMPLPALTGVAPLINVAYINHLGSPLSADGWQVESVPRLFPREAFEYRGVVHELPVLKPARAARVVTYSHHALALHHHGYRPELLRAQDKLARNVALLRVRTSAAPADLNGRYMLGRELLLSGAHAEAFDVLSGLIEAWPSERRAAIPRMAAGYRAMALAEQGRHEDAVAALLAARELDEHYPSYWFLAGESLLALGRHADAAAAFQGAIARRDYAARFGITTFNSVIPAHAGALAYERLRKARALDAGLASVTGRESPGPIAAAIAALELGDLGAAAEWLAQAEREAPAHSQVPFLQAELALRDDDLALALERVWRSLQLGPARPDPWALAGYVLHQLGDSALAEAFLARALALDPDHPSAQRLLVLVRVAARSYGRHTALSAWFEALDAVPMGQP